MLMTCEEAAWEKREWSIELTRFLEYTAEPIAQYFKQLNNEVIAKILEMPTLFTYEGAGSLPSRVGKITRIIRSHRDLKIQWEPYVDIPPIQPNVIYDLFPQLDIDLGWESSRTHWAIKEVPLLEILRNANIAPSVGPTAKQVFANTSHAFVHGYPQPAGNFQSQPVASAPVLFGFIPPVPPPPFIAPPPPPPAAAAVKVFISYSWDSQEHKEWVEGLAKYLRVQHGIDATIDTWDLSGGQDLTMYMEASIKSADRVLVIYTESAVNKAATRSGGIGYEHVIVTAEIMRNMGTFKFIPIVRQTNRPYILPPQFENRLRYDLGNGPDFAAELEKLVKELLNIRPVRPPLGRSPYHMN